jgi:hypothetical protein
LAQLRELLLEDGDGNPGRRFDASEDLTLRQRVELRQRQVAEQGRERLELRRAGQCLGGGKQRVGIFSGHEGREAVRFTGL